MLGDYILLHIEKVPPKKNIKERSKLEDENIEYIFEKKMTYKYINVFSIALREHIFSGLLHFYPIREPT